MNTLILHNVHWFDSATFKKGIITLSNQRISSVVSTGSDQKTPLPHSSSCTNNTTVMDCEGMYLVPSFTEAHMHFSTFVSSLAYIDLGTARKKEDLKKCFSLRQPSQPEQWIGFSNFHQNTFEDELPSAKYLDSFFPCNPVVVSSFDLHSCVLNAVAIEQLKGAGILEPISKNADRDLHLKRGLCYEEDAFAVMGYVNRKLTAQSPSLVRDAVRALNAQGITAAMSYDGEADLTTLSGWTNSNDFTLRIMTSSRDYTFSSATEYALSQSGKWRNEPTADCPFHLKRVEYGPLKIFTDGALGSQTALMSQPYQNSENMGIEVTSTAELTGLIQECKRFNIPVAVHSIGDKACDNVLFAFSKNNSEYNTKMRNRVEHVQYLRDEHLLGLKEAGLSATTLPIHLPWDFQPSIRLLGKERTAWIHRLRDISEHGIPFAITSDCPVASPSPLHGFQWAVSGRKDLERALGRGFRSQAISPVSGLRAITSTPAWLLYGEQYWGSIKEGMSGDLVLLSSNPLSADEENAPEVMLTIFEGNIVFQR